MHGVWQQTETQRWGCETSKEYPAQYFIVSSHHMWQGQCRIIDQTMNLQRTLHCSPSQGSCGVSSNSLAPGRFKVNFRWVKSAVNGWGISCENALIWVSLDHTYDQSTLVQVMAWCRQATSHYLSQCWPRSLSPYGVTRPQWVRSNFGEKWVLQGGLLQHNYWPDDNIMSLDQLLHLFLASLHF